MFHGYNYFCMMANFNPPNTLNFSQMNLKRTRTVLNRLNVCGTEMFPLAPFFLLLLKLGGTIG